jgi:hypothetical protein
MRRCEIEVKLYGLLSIVSLRPVLSGCSSWHVHAFTFALECLFKFLPVLAPALMCVQETIDDFYYACSLKRLGAVEKSKQSQAFGTDHKKCAKSESEYPPSTDKIPSVRNHQQYASGTRRGRRRN